MSDPKTAFDEYVAGREHDPEYQRRKRQGESIQPQPLGIRGFFSLAFAVIVIAAMMIWPLGRGLGFW